MPAAFEIITGVTAGARVPVLWICGPAGVGKSTVSWRLYTELASSGVHVAFADSDQLCMCYPAPAGDPGRQHVKALNVGAGGSWPEPGDRLRGQSVGFLTSVSDQAVQAAEALDRSDVGGVAVDTTSLSLDESASMIRDAIGWP
ncbi:MAG TPA: hypothetical protein VF482_14010 [Trebonia sp.]